MSNIALQNMISPISGKFNMLPSLRDSIEQSLDLLLKITRTELMGDPDFGSNFKEFKFEMNKFILADRIIADLEKSIISSNLPITIDKSSTSVSIEADLIYIKLVYYLNNLSLPIVYNSKIAIE
jgi:hypothetical protein